MYTRNSLNVNDLGLTVGLLEAGQSVTTLATVMGTSNSVILLWVKIDQVNNAIRKHAVIGEGTQHFQRIGV